MDETCDPVDVRQFGAKGDGETDDAATFQAAVNHLRGKEGRIIFSAAPSGELDQPQSDLVE